MNNNQQEEDYPCTYKKCKTIKVQPALWVRRRNFELVLVEKERHYNTHQVNNNVKEDGFFIAMMCEDPEVHTVYQRIK